MLARDLVIVASALLASIVSRVRRPVIPASARHANRVMPVRRPATLLNVIPVSYVILVSPVIPHSARPARIAIHARPVLLDSVPLVSLVMCARHVIPVNALPARLVTRVRLRVILISVRHVRTVIRAFVLRAKSVSIVKCKE
jgi:hypothetical protein